MVPIDNKARKGLGFYPIIARPAKKDKSIRLIHDFFHSGGFLHPISQEVHTIEESDSDSFDEEWETYYSNEGYMSQEERYRPSRFPKQVPRDTLKPNAIMVYEDYNPEGCRAPPNSLEDTPMKDNFGYTSDDPMDDLPIWEPYAENPGYES